MQIENHWLQRDAAYWAEMSEDVNPCDGCKDYNLSSCCNAPIKWSDICSECGEHCETMCEDCDKR